MNIRRPTAEDVSPIVEDLWFPFAREMASIDPFDELESGIEDEAISYRAELVERPDVAMWIAIDRDAYVGLATVEHQQRPPVFARGDGAHIHELYVAPGYRGTGLASDLLTRVEGWAEDRDCSHLTLDVNAANGRALSFYRTRGFETKRREMVRPLDRA